ncbi:MAG TPA: NAD(+)/NADH kinase [Thermoplasmata archaeon]|nr:NAD(+)/NADH kinase [Thermoplasmata archaeon]
MKLVLHANPNRPAAVALVEQIRRSIGDRASVALTEELGAVAPELPHLPWAQLEGEVVVAVGGDGTFLHALRRTSLPLLPVNAGTLGVLAEVDARRPGEVDGAVTRLLERRYFVEERTKLAAEVDGRPLPDATNEYVVHATQVGKMGAFELAFDGRPAGFTRADGLIVATPTGSTAYALSSFGPIVEPEVDGFVLTAIAPFRAEARALVLGSLRTLRIRSRGGAGTCVVLADGAGEFPVPPDGAVTIYRSPRRASLVRFGTTFFDRLRGKRILPWSEEAEVGGVAVLPPEP